MQCGECNLFSFSLHLFKIRLFLLLNNVRGVVGKLPFKSNLLQNNHPSRLGAAGPIMSHLWQRKDTKSIGKQGNRPCFPKSHGLHGVFEAFVNSIHALEGREQAATAQIMQRRNPPSIFT